MEPEKGVHALSLYGTALFDYALTIAAAVLATASTGVPLVLTTIAMLVLSLAAHAAFGIDTRTMRWLRAVSKPRF
jgi:hypothetical protein